MASEFEQVDLFCYRRHGFMPNALVLKAQIRGTWAICPRCALGADPDPKCLREIHWAAIVSDKLATRFKRITYAPTPKIRKMGMVVPGTTPRAGGATAEDYKKRDAALHRQDDDARVQGYKDQDHKLSELADVERLRQRYLQRIREVG